MAGVQEAIQSLLGTLCLPVSAYSAIKVGGVPLYKKARHAAHEGTTFDEVPVRGMYVQEAELLDYKIGECRIEDASPLEVINLKNNRAAGQARSKAIKEL